MVLVLNLLSKGLISFRENIFHINISSFLHIDNVRCHIMAIVDVELSMLN
jgi:hypothetical protein